jgi:hypothetical protein
MIKVDSYLRQIAQAVTTKSIQTGQQPAAVTDATGTNIEVKESNVSVATDIGILDFGTGFDITAASGEAEVAMDLSEVQHDTLGGLADDDHTQYILVAGTRAFTGDQSMAGFDLTNVTELTGAASVPLTLISNETDGATNDAFIFNANIGGAPTDGFAYLSMGYDNSGYVEQFKFQHDATFGPSIGVDSGSTWRGFVGYPGTSGRWTGIAMQAAILRFRVNDNNSFDVTDDSLAPLNTSTFSFNSKLAGRTTTVPVYRFGVATANTAGAIYQIWNNATWTGNAEWEVDYLGVTTQEGSVKFRNATSFTMELTGTPTANRVITFQDVAGTVYVGGGTDVAVADGGTGASTAQAGFDALSPVTTQGDTIFRDASNNTRLAIGTAFQYKRTNSGATAPEWYTLEHHPSITIEDPVENDLFGMWITNKAITVTEIQAICEGGTSVVCNIEHAATVTAAGTLIDQITPTTSIVSETTITSPNVAANQVISINLGTVTGSVNSVTVTVYYRENA